MYEEVAASAARDGARVNAIGFSQGTATATRWAMHGSAPLHRLVLWGGLMPPEVDLSRGGEVLRGARLTLVVGNKDHYVTNSVLAAEQSRLDSAGVLYDTVTFDGGHVVSRKAFSRLLAEPGAAAGV